MNTRSINHSAAAVVAVVRIATLLALLLANLAPITPAMARAVEATPATVTNQQAAPAALAQANIGATKTDALLLDQDGDGRADPGDTLRYTVVVSNSGGIDASAVVVNDALDAPTALAPGSVKTTLLAFDLAASTTEDTLVALVLTGADADGDSLTFSVLTAPAHGSLSGTAPNLIYSPALDYNGADSLTFRVCDSSVPAGCDTATARLTISPTNDNPNAVDDNLTVLEDSVTTPIDALANDTGAPDTGETLTILAVGPSKNSSTSIVGGASLSYSPNPDFLGTDVFSHTIDDGNGGTDTAAITVTVTTINDPPAFTKGPDETVLEDAGPQAVTGWATSISPGPSDEAGQTLTFNVTGNSNPGLFSASPAISPAGDLTYTPAANASGTATITITLQDNGGTASGGVDTSASQSFTITVPVMRPVAVAAELSPELAGFGVGTGVRVGAGVRVGRAGGSVCARATEMPSLPSESSATNTPRLPSSRAVPRIVRRIRSLHIAWRNVVAHAPPVHTCFAGRIGQAPTSRTIVGEDLSRGCARKPLPCAKAR